MRRQINTERINKIVSLCANIAVIFGIIIALTQYLQTEKFNKEQKIDNQITEKKRYAVEALDEVYNQDFLNGYSILIDIDSIANISQINAFNLVFNSYYKIAIVYNKEICDTSIINNSIKTSLTEFTKSSVFQNTKPCFEKFEIEKMLNHINKSNE